MIGHKGDLSKKYAQSYEDTVSIIKEQPTYKVMKRPVWAGSWGHRDLCPGRWNELGISMYASSRVEVGGEGRALG